MARISLSSQYMILLHEIAPLCLSNRTEDRGRERLVMENEEYLYQAKTSHGREGEFFQPRNPELIERFEATHEYIKNVYKHSKGISINILDSFYLGATLLYFDQLDFPADNLIPPGDEFAEVHDRVKYFCGVTNEALLEKLKETEERVMQSEWSGRVKDAKVRLLAAHAQSSV